MKKLRPLLFIALWMLAIGIYAQPNGTGSYYQGADGKKGKNLKTALCDIIKSPKVKSYDQLWECYKKTDLRTDGKIWDMYSNKTNFDPDKGHTGNYSKEGDMYNREHSFPKSWFNEGKPMYSDLFHVVPTAGYVNNRRSNYPFGENNGEKYMSNDGFSKVGACTVPGYSGVVFEPNDEYKGDFARIYFYMATCYENQISSWSSAMLDGSSYPAYKSWALKMLLQWAANDPVSQKEIDRNNAVYSLQGNRNPYVDYPGLEQYVWGSKTDIAFSYDNYGSTIEPEQPEQPENPDKPDTPDTPEEPQDPNPVDGEQQYLLVASADDLTAGSNYLIVYTTGNSEGKALADLLSTGKAYGVTSVIIENDVISTEVNGDNLPHNVLISADGNKYTMYDTKTKQYLSLTSSDNYLKAVDSVSGDTEQWYITISDGYANISNCKYTSRTIRYNSSSPRFACYSSGQQPVRLYKQKQTTDISGITSANYLYPIIYTLDGRKMTNVKPGLHPSSYLPKGIYIMNGKKIVVR